MEKLLSVTCSIAPKLSYYSNLIDPKRYLQYACSISDLNDPCSFLLFACVIPLSLYNYIVCLTNDHGKITI